MRKWTVATVVCMIAVSSTLVAQSGGGTPAARSAPPTTTSTAPATTSTTPATATNEPGPPPLPPAAIPPGEIWSVYVPRPYSDTAPRLHVYHDRVLTKLDVTAEIKNSPALAALTYGTWAHVRVDKNTITRVEDIQTGSGLRAFALLGIGAPLLVLLIVGHRLVMGADGRYSKSKFQLALWFGVLFLSYLSACVTRAAVAGTPLFGGVDIPAHLAVLSGISAFTFGAAKGIRVNKENQKAVAAAAVAVAAAAPAQPAVVAVVTPPKASRGFWRDLVVGEDGAPDIGDVQMLVLTFTGVVVYLVQIWAWLTNIQVFTPALLPDVDTTILAAVGLGQGAYLLKKQVGD